VILSLLAGVLWLRSLKADRPSKPETPGDRAWNAALAPYGSLGDRDPAALARIWILEGSLQIRVEARQHRPDLVTVLFPESPMLAGVTIQGAPESLPWVRPPEGGDSKFESTFRVAGPELVVSALLDAETRRLILSLSSQDVAISDGQVRAEMSAEQAPRLLPRLLDTAKRLSQPFDVMERLAENALKDPIAEVRLRNLVLLLRESAENDSKTVATLRAACADRNAKVRLRAAKEMGAEGYAVIAELTGSVQDEVSEEAVRLLGPNLPLPRLREILAQAVHHRHVRTARACLETLGLSGDAADVEALAKVMAVHEGELATAAARALGTIGSPAAEPSLILALQRQQEDLQVAAAEALGRLGSAAAVLPLQEAAGSTRRSALRKATREAVAAIQSRLLGATPGQLSLSGAGSGNLSLAQAEGGELSTAADAEGQLALSDGEEEV
jgi:HEAT repeat protein